MSKIITKKRNVQTRFQDRNENYFKQDREEENTALKLTN